MMIGILQDKYDMPKDFRDKVAEICFTETDDHTAETIKGIRCVTDFAQYNTLFTMSEQCFDFLASCREISTLYRLRQGQGRILYRYSMAGFG